MSDGPPHPQQLGGSSHLGQSSLIAALSTPSQPMQQQMNQQEQFNMPYQHGPGGPGPGPMRIPQQVRPVMAPYQQHQPGGPPPNGSPMPPSLRMQQNHGGPPPPQQVFHQQQPQPMIVRTMQPGGPSTSSHMPPQIINGPITMSGVSAAASMHSQSPAQSMAPPPSHQPPPLPQQQQQVVQVQQQQPAVVHMPTSGHGSLIDKVRLDDLVKQIDPSTVLEDNVKEALIEYADEFVQEVIDKVLRLVHHRGGANKRMEVRDVELVLDMVFNMPAVPRAAVHVFGAAATAVPRLDKDPPTDAHKQRMMLIKKQLKKI